MAESRGLACFGGGSGTLQKQQKQSDRGNKRCGYSLKYRTFLGFFNQVYKRFRIFLKNDPRSGMH